MYNLSYLAKARDDRLFETELMGGSVLGHYNGILRGDF